MSPPQDTVEARRARIQGVVSLSPGLDEQAIAAAEQSRFEPATKDGKPVEVCFDLTYNLRLAPNRRP